MLDTIKRYELSDNVDIELLKKVGFRDFKSPFKKGKYLIENQYLKDEISLYIKIKIQDDNSLYFDDFDSITVIDEEFGQPYTSFYQDKEFPYLNDVINNYNKCMDTLVMMGILKEKEKQKVKIK